MQHRALAHVVSMARLARGVRMVANPGFWLNRGLNPFADETSFERRRDAAAFRLDMLSQVLLDRPLLREQWQRSVRSRPQVAGEVLPLPEWDWKDGDLEDFARTYRDVHRPVVFRGLLHRHPHFREWDFEAFVRTYAKERVVLCCPVKDGYDGTVAELDIPGVYLHNSERLLSRYPELLRDAGFDLIPRTVAQGIRFTGVVQLFVGRANTGSWWHCANGLNFFACLTGRKRWQFIDSSQSPLLNPRTGGGARGTYFWSDSGAETAAFRQAAELAGAEADVEDWVLQAAAGCRRWEVVLEPGDLLFNPPFMWHQVENLDDATIGMATRWFDLRNRQFPNDVFSVGECLRPRPTREMARSFLGQPLVRPDGTVDYEAFRADIDEGVLTAKTRSAMSRYMDVDPSVQAYYDRARAGTIDFPGDLR